MKRLILTTFLLVYYAPLITAQPVACDATDGDGIVACVERAYPDRLAAGVSLDQRKAHMAFLRDRVIETARCKMIDVGLNCKRGNCSNISLDFIALKTGARVEGVDIGARYDDLTRPLDLMWHTYGPPDYGFPTYKAYGPVSCVAPPDPEPPMSDIGELKQQIAALEEKLAVASLALGAQIAYVEQVLRQQIQSEAMDRINGDVALREDVTRIDAKPIPQRCTAKAFGVKLGCSLE